MGKDWWSEFISASLNAPSGDDSEPRRVLLALGIRLTRSGHSLGNHLNLGQITWGSSRKPGGMAVIDETFVAQSPPNPGHNFFVFRIPDIVVFHRANISPDAFLLWSTSTLSETTYGIHWPLNPSRNGISICHDSNSSGKVLRMGNRCNMPFPRTLPLHVTAKSDGAECGNTESRREVRLNTWVARHMYGYFINTSCTCKRTPPLWPAYPLNYALSSQRLIFGFHIVFRHFNKNLQAFSAPVYLHMKIGVAHGPTESNWLARRGVRRLTASYSSVEDCVPGGLLTFLSMKNGAKYDTYTNPRAKTHEFCGFTLLSWWDI